MRPVAHTVAHTVALVAGAVAGAGCGGASGGTWHAPIGWVGGSGDFAGCDPPITMVSGKAAADVDDGGWLRARARGEARFRCKDGEERALKVFVADRIVIEGPTEVERGSRVSYSVHAEGGGQSDLRLDGATPLDWSTSDGSELDAGYCSDMPMFGCPDDDHARLKADTAGTVTIRVTFGALVGSLAVVVR